MKAKYNTMLPYLVQLNKKCQMSLKTRGYIKTLGGRRSHIDPPIYEPGGARTFEYKALNKLIQGSAADIIKIAMINIHQKLSAGNHKTKMLLQVHDELVFDVYKPELETMKMLIKTEMENAYKLTVPLDVYFVFGANWLEAH